MTLPTWLINWKTTLSGAVVVAAAVGRAVPQLQPYVDVLNNIMGIAAGFGLLSAKDSNVTGGKISNVTGAVSKPVSLVDKQ